MIRNDYRRSLIMLRVQERGYSGRVRLEHRVLTGSMYFVVNAPANGNLLCATLVRRDAQGVYFGTKLGELRRDSRGQATLAYSFDPRNIDGYPLDDYLMIAVVERKADRCDLVLTGNVNGSQEVNLASVANAACQECWLSQPQNPQPRPPVQRPQPPQRPRPPQQEETPMPPNLIQPRGSEPGDDQEEAQPDDDEAGFRSDGFAAPAADLPEAEAEAQMQSEVDNPEQLLDFDPLVSWAGAAEPLRDLFASTPLTDDAPDDGYSYILAPMPEDSGYDRMAIGVRLENGMPASVSYALPSVSAAEPPQELENYVWYGKEDEGWWVLHVDAASGEPLDSVKF